MMHSLTYLDLRHDLYCVCTFIAANAFIANFLPDASLLKPSWKRTCYTVFIDLVAGFALNWRVHIPSLDQEFLGFRRKIRHGLRNWRQRRVDRLYRRSTVWHP